MCEAPTSGHKKGAKDKGGKGWEFIERELLRNRRGPESGLLLRFFFKGIL